MPRSIPQQQQESNSYNAKRQELKELQRHKRDERFWDGGQKAATSALAATSAADVVQTCRNLLRPGNPGHEDWFPSQDCAVIVASVATGNVATAFVEWEFHRHGHEKLRKILQIVAPGPGIAGITYSKVNKAW